MSRLILARRVVLRQQCDKSLGSLMAFGIDRHVAQMAKTKTRENRLDHASASVRRMYAFGFASMVSVQSGQQSATIHSPWLIRVNHFVLFGHRRSCFGVGLADVPECSVLQHFPQSRHVRFGVLRKGLHATWAAQIDHDALVVDAGKSASSFHVLAADDAAWRFVLISDGVFEAHTSSFVSSRFSISTGAGDNVLNRRERHR